MGIIRVIDRVDDCALIYIGSAAPEATSSNTLRGRYQEFANRHIAMHRVRALLYSDWYLEFGLAEVLSRMFETVASR